MINTLKEFAHDSARRYLQSAVFVDDEIFDKHSGMALDPADLPKPRKRIFLREPEGENIVGVDQATPDGPDTDRHYHPKELVSSFAREGIICALYEPPEGFSTSPDSEIFKLCERPDIIILDWDFSGDRGQKALDLIAVLVKQSNEEFPHHTRLLSIYTSDPSLTGVADSVADRLRREGFEAQPVRSQCRIRYGATRLLILGKDIPRFGEEEFTVEEKDLASRLIEEFADMNSGILPSYALNGMAAVRRNSKRILDRFHSDLDGAFLLQRALIMEVEDAFEQLPELLAEELLAVINAEHTKSAGINAVGEEVASNLRVGEPATPWCDRNGRPVATSNILRNILKGGRASLTQDNKECRQAGDLAKKGWRGVDAQVIRDLHMMVDPDATESNQRLASLFVTRTQYHSEARNLSYGTVVRHRGADGREPDWSYSFCVMPACDAVRLNLTRQFKEEKPVAFPFWKLREDIDNRGAVGRGLVIELPDGSYVELSAGGKARDMLWVVSFQVNKTTGTVVAERSKDARFFFIPDQEVEIEWIAQLKPLHAQRIAHDIGQSLSRVGLVEAEWLRLLCER